MTEAARRKAAGWPVLLRDAKGMRVTTRRDMGNGLMQVPAGAPGVVETAGNGWHLLQFRGDACAHCGVAPRISRLSWSDLNPSRDSHVTTPKEHS